MQKYHRSKIRLVETLESRFLLTGLAEGANTTSDPDALLATSQQGDLHASISESIDTSPDQQDPFDPNQVLEMRDGIRLSQVVDVLDCGTDFPGATNPPETGCADIDEGYTTRWSYDQGEVVEFHLSGSGDALQKDVKATIYDSALRPYMTFVIGELKPQTVNSDAPYKNGYGYEVTARVQLPVNMPSGIYFLAKPFPSKSTGGGQIPFIVRRASRQSDIVVVHGSNTANAYSEMGGKGNYSVPRSEPDPLITFQRPKNHNHRTQPINKWFAERHDTFDHRFISSTDLDHYSQLSGSRLVVIAGHAEYWSQRAVNNLDRFVDEGGELLVLGGNTMYKEVRYCYADDRDTNTPCDAIAESYVGDPNNDEPIALRYYNTRRPNTDRPAAHDEVPGPRPYDEVRDVIGLSYNWGLRAFNICAPARNGFKFDLSIPGCRGWSQLPLHGFGGYKFVTPDRPYLDGVMLPRLVGAGFASIFSVELDENRRPIRDPIEKGSILNLWNSEYDGFPNDGLDTFPEGDWLTRPEYNELPEEVFLTGYPIVDEEYLSGFHEYHLIGFDYGFAPNQSQNLRKLRMGGWIEYQRTPTSGRVINTGASDWGNYAFRSCPDLTTPFGTECAYKHGSEVQEITARMINYLLDDTARPGDFNDDGSLDTRDINALTDAVMQGADDTKFDVNNDGLIDQDDRIEWIFNLAGTTYGDANMDGIFNSSDLVTVFQVAEYEDDVAKNSTWEEGDWNGDGEFNSRDLVFAFRDGHFTAGATSAAPNGAAGLLGLGSDNLRDDELKKARPK